MRMRAVGKAPNSCGKEVGNLYGLIVVQLLELNFKVLWEQLANKYRSVHRSHGAHALAQMRGEVTGALHNPRRLIGRHPCTRRTRSRGPGGLLEVHEAIV